MKKFKKILYKTLMIGIVLLSIVLINANYKNGVEKCIAGGNSRHYCEVQLAK